MIFKYVCLDITINSSSTATNMVMVSSMSSLDQLKAVELLFGELYYAKVCKNLKLCHLYKFFILTRLLKLILLQLFMFNKFLTNHPLLLGLH